VTLSMAQNGTLTLFPSGILLVAEGDKMGWQFIVIRPFNVNKEKNRVIEMRCGGIRVMEGW